MLVSVIVISKDEAPRLKLTLAALSCQSIPTVGVEGGTSAVDVAQEVIVVNDGSSDGTHELLEHFDSIPLRVFHNDVCKGRSASRNIGAAEARGDILVFLDGDCLVDRDFSEVHAGVHAGNCVMARGETYHLRCTRFFSDPEKGIPHAEHRVRVQELTGQLHKYLVTQAQVVDDFASIIRRARVGIYPGIGPGRLYEAEMEALNCNPPPDSLWLTAAAQNMSFHRETFLRLNGFRPEMRINEHRELAYRMHRDGIPMRLARTRSYHLTHRVGWRDPVKDDSTWERQFYDYHPAPAVRLMSIFWQSLVRDPHIPEPLRIESVAKLDQIVRSGDLSAYDRLRSSHPFLRELNG